VQQQPGGGVGGDADVGAFGGQSAAVQGFGDDLVDFDGGQFGKPFGALQPRQRDQFGDQGAQPVGLVEDFGAEPADLVRIVGGI
jgi:hypothetical protein